MWIVFIDLFLHGSLSLILGTIFYYYTHRVSWFILALAGGILIDVDHFADYFIYYGKRFNIKKFLFDLKMDQKKVYIVLHSWELVILLWCLTLFVNWVVPIAASMTIHLIIDQFHWEKRKLFYFLLYRWYHKFDKYILVPGNSQKSGG